jgi:hypothetical protein
MKQTMSNNINTYKNRYPENFLYDEFCRNELTGSIECN